MPAARVKPLPLLILAAIVLGAGAIVWHKVIQDHFIPRNFGVVVEGKLYRSGRLTDSAFGIIHDDHHIRTIVDLGAHAPDSEGDLAAQAAADRLGLTRYVFALKGDGTGNPNDYVRALQLMADPANQPVLVMCSAGAQRTSAAVILYHKVIEGRLIEDVYSEAFHYKHDPGGDWIMLAYLADWADKIEQSFRSGEPIAGQPPAHVVTHVRREPREAQSMGAPTENPAVSTAAP